MLGVAFGYYVLGYVGTVLSLPPAGFAIVWPATAFLTGAFLLTPVRYWWVYLLVLIPAHFHLVAHFRTPPPSLTRAATQIIGNVGLAAATAFALRVACKGGVRFDTFKGALIFILVAALAVPAGVNSLVIFTHLLAGWARDFWPSLRQWMLASIFPTLTVTPLVVLAASGGVIRPGVLHRPRAEVGALSAALFVLTFVAFGWRWESDYAATLLLLPLPILLWAAARWNVGGASLALLVAAAAILLRALGGRGPFALGASTVSMVSLQVYLTAVSIPLILLAALMDERRRGEEQLRRSEARMGIAAASTDTGLWQWDGPTGQLWMTEHCGKMFGLRPDAANTPFAFLDAVHAEDRPRVRAAIEGALASVDVQTLSEFRVVAGGDERWFVLRTCAEQGADRKAIRVSGLVRDVTQRRIAQQQSEQLSNRLLTLQDEERKNIAEALHDSTTQHLVAVGLITGMLERRMTLTEETRMLLDDMRDSLAKAVNELRAFTYLLRPPELEQQGLCDVLQKYVRGFGMRTGVRVHSRLSEAADALPIERQRALFRIAQESLANVYRHAAATRVWVGLRRHGQELHLVIRDDGRGMPTGRGEQIRLGVGIPGMAARIRQLGGKIDIRSRPNGATVHVALPIGVDEGPPRPALAATAQEV